MFVWYLVRREGLERKFGDQPIEFVWVSFVLIE